ncbi:hypothetical protein UFOVP68_51 [uncultured Caudovirales phage]|uniref:DUF7227 domain-containing protein n=1 Tax=uncultured Caudovirales phage TaxID=2100421 RepID=A0A6J5L2G1_9CAUD|nr:hypothetical protein UFOVP68_51 [uncultured Caudovirales phage]
MNVMSPFAFAAVTGTFHLTLKSRNAKTGPIPVSTSTADTCPTVCPFNSGNGCYAASGPLALHWRKVTDGRSGASYAALLDQIAALPDGQLWRHNQAGDLAGIGDALDVDALDALTAANVGRRGFTYTHKPLTTAAERDAVARANANGFTVNLSGNDLAHADALADLAIAPVVVVLPADATQNTVTPAGRKVTVCPATIRDDISCVDCQLCARLRDAIVGFPAHGTSKRKADAVARKVAA